MLLYPRSEAQQIGSSLPYAASESLPGYSHNCGTYYVDLFDNKDRLRQDVGVELIQRVILSSSTTA